MSSHGMMHETDVSMGQPNAFNVSYPLANHVPGTLDKCS
jgi:hypothetical protein